MKPRLWVAIYKQGVPAIHWRYRDDAIDSGICGILFHDQSLADQYRIAVGKLIIRTWTVSYQDWGQIGVDI